MDFLNDLEFDWRIASLIVAIIISAFILSRTVRWLINRVFINESAKINVDPTRYKFFKNTISFLIWVLALAAIISLVPKLKALAITMFAGAGLMVVVIGLAAQQAFANIISGIFIVLFKPFRVGDMIKVGSRDYGIVEDITLRHTVILSFESKRIIIPNSVISSETIVNDSIDDSSVIKYVEIGISYDSDVDLATKILQEEAMKHEDCLDNRTKEDIKNGLPQVQVRLTSFGDYSINLRAYVWVSDPVKAIAMHAALNRRIKKRFDEEGIEIPFPYRTVVYKKDLPENTNAQKNE